ncbi:MAG: Uma2 family endonuclease [Flavobacteriales bacterium]|nr:Uma2 family endonuclease [Flavobacteriales bacterium]
MKVEEPIYEYGKLDLSESYTYLDYLKFRFKERVELIKGAIYKMAPAPNRWHQETSMNLTIRVAKSFKGIPCKMYVAPFDVRLPIPNKTRPNTVVQPDLCIVCDQTKLDDAGCNGVPDLIVEILSPGNTEHDLTTKFNLYQEVQLPEYWIVNPWDKTVIIYTLRDEIFIGSKIYSISETAESRIFTELKVALEDIFEGVE